MKLTFAEYDRRDDRLHKALKPMLTEEFLCVLAKAVRVAAWGIEDRLDTRTFVRRLFEIAGEEPPTYEELGPYMGRYRCV